MLEDPELVTLIPEEEDPRPPVSPQFKAVRNLVIDVSALIALKVAMVFVTRRLVKSVHEVNKLNIPQQWYREED